MVPTRERQLRTDAVRNASRIIASAQRVFASVGPKAAMEDVAADAGVGVATVYRRFPTKEALLRVVLDRRFDEVVGAALERAQHEVDARDAMRAALRGAVSFIAGDPNTMAAAMSSGLMTMDLAYRFFEPVAAIVRRGQDDGVFRDDLVAEDVPRIVHRVRAGETLFSIARKYQTTVAQLKESNKLRSSTLRVGTRLVVQGGRSSVNQQQ